MLESSAAQAAGFPRRSREERTLASLPLCQWYGSAEYLQIRRRIAASLLTLRPRLHGRASPEVRPSDLQAISFLRKPEERRPRRERRGGGDLRRSLTFSVCEIIADLGTHGRLARLHSPGTYVSNPIGFNVFSG